MMTHDLPTFFRALHRGPDPLILCNAWDAGSARMIRSQGARAIATTSAGMAWALGIADGNHLPADLLLAMSAGIVKAVPDLPVSIDMEAGYNDDPATVADLARRVVETGVAGINIEDGTDAPDLLAAKIAAIRKAVGPALFINARTDVYLRQLVPGESRVAEVIKRGEFYGAAGADGLFTPGLMDRAAIGDIAAGTSLPLNVMAVPGLPAVAELAALGVRRLSSGSALPQHLWARVASLAGAFLTDGASDPLWVESMAYPQINAMMAGASA
ncbi:isocitrate lyase/PEP mutase family protein [Niveispirillum fermenti]|uniref:isocitrate lyase/PEP mutase family protein n=1 Tax=Niveispirillum fermenti TaxID=1233113 RepID=UPI003A8BF8BA